MLQQIVEFPSFSRLNNSPSYVNTIICLSLHLLMVRRHTIQAQGSMCIIFLVNLMVKRCTYARALYLC